MTGSAAWLPPHALTVPGTVEMGSPFSTAVEGDALTCTISCPPPKSG
jgi:hypothetical protein